MATWSLPVPEKEGYGISSSLPLRRIPMEVGPDRVNVLGASYLSDITVNVVLTDIQLSELNDFVDNEITFGADWFDMPISTGGDVTLHTVRLKSNISAVPQGLEWRVTFVVETEERQ